VAFLRSGRIWTQDSSPGGRNRFIGFGKSLFFTMVMDKVEVKEEGEAFWETFEAFSDIQRDISRHSKRPFWAFYF